MSMLEPKMCLPFDRNYVYCADAFSIFKNSLFFPVLIVSLKKKTLLNKLLLHFYHQQL